MIWIIEYNLDTKRNKEIIRKMGPIKGNEVNRLEVLMGLSIREAVLENRCRKFRDEYSKSGKSENKTLILLSCVS